jgi:hypothetical protein
MTKTPRPAVRKLGDILVDCRVVTQEQVDLALAEQRRSGRKLFGEALLDLGFISEDDLGWALSNQLNIPYIDLNADMVDLGAVSLLGPQLMRRHRLLPLVKAGDDLTIVLADPTNTEALTEVEEVTGFKVQPSIASPRRVTKVLDEVLGPETRTEETSDLLFAEITRPYLSEGRHVTERLNPLGQLFSVALRDNVEEVHLEPAGDAVRVRFRRGGKLEDQPPIQAEDFRTLIDRFENHVPRAKQGSPDIPRWHSTVEFAAGVLDLCVTLLRTPSGTGLVLELRKGRARPYRIEDLGLDERETGSLTAMLKSSGMILVTGPDPAARFTVLSALATAVDASARRIVAFGERLSLKWDGLTHFVPPDPSSSPDAIRRDLYGFRYIDALLLDEIALGPDLDAAVMAAACGKLILAPYGGPDALTTLANLARQCGTPATLAQGMTAVIEATWNARGLPAASLLPVTGPLRAALERQVTHARLERASASAGFRSLFEGAGSRETLQVTTGRKALEAA